MEACLADGDQGGQGVADDRHPQPPVEAVRQGGKLEGELGHEAPGIACRSQSPAEGAHGQDRSREGAVGAVAVGDGGGQLLGLNASRGAGEPGLRVATSGPLVVRKRHACGHRAEGGPGESSGGEVGGGADGVAPAAVGVAIGGEPVEAAANQRLVGGGVNEGECGDGGGGGEGAAGELALPVATRAAGGEEALAGGVEGRADGRSIA